MALVAMIREKLVVRDKVIGDEVITEGVAVASVLPGPVAVNVAAYVGYIMAGVRGAVVTVIAVLIPSFLLVLGFAALYFSYGEQLRAVAIMNGIIPVILALLFTVAVTMGLNNVKSWLDIIILSGSATFLFFFPKYESVLGILLVTAVLGIIFKKQAGGSMNAAARSKMGYLIGAVLVFIIMYAVARLFFAESNNARLFTEFVTVSLTLFGGGYVMIPMLKSLLVEQTHWFTLDEFMAGISAGQITPGPILISSAFFGYKLSGIPGAIIATVAIFFTSSVVMILVSKFFVQVRANRFVQSALAGIKPAVVGLITAAAISIFADYGQLDNSIVFFMTMLISFLLFFRFKVNPAIVVVISGVIGYFVYSS